MHKPFLTYMNQYILAALLLCSVQAMAQPYHRYRYIGQANDDQIYDFVASSDGNFIAVGGIKSNNSTIVHGTLVAKDALITKISPNGSIIWAYSYGGNYDEELYRIIRHQGFYYCIGYTKSYVISGGNTTTDIFLVKINEAGVVQWAKNFGDPVSSSTRVNDQGFLVIETSGPDILIVGTNGHGNNSDSNILIFRVQPNGNVTFAKSYSDGSTNNGSDFAREIIRYGNEYVLACQRLNSSNSNGSRESVLMKIREDNGNIDWARSLNGSPSNSNGIYSLYFDTQREKIVAGGFYAVSGSDIEPIIFNDIRWSNGTSFLATPRARLYSVNTNAYTQAQVFAKSPASSGIFVNFIGAINTTGNDVVMGNIDSTFTAISEQRRFGGGGYEQIRRPVSLPVGNDVVAMGFTNSAPSCGYDILFSRMKSNLDFDSTTSAACIKTAAIQVTNMNYTNTALSTFTATDLTVSSWHATIAVGGLSPFDVSAHLSLRYDRCGCSTGSVNPNCTTSSGAALRISMSQPASGDEATFTGDLDPIKKQDILYFYFRIFDPSDLTYYETDKEQNLKNGVNLKKGQKGLTTGLYYWQYEATMKDGSTIQDGGTFTIK
jgi:hypothetical protein